MIQILLDIYRADPGQIAFGAGFLAGCFFAVLMVEILNPVEKIK